MVEPVKQQREIALPLSSVRKEPYLSDLSQRGFLRKPVYKVCR